MIIPDLFISTFLPALAMVLLLGSNLHSDLENLRDMLPIFLAEYLEPAKDAMCF